MVEAIVVPVTNVASPGDPVLCDCDSWKIGNIGYIVECQWFSRQHLGNMKSNSGNIIVIADGGLGFLDLTDSRAPVARAVTAQRAVTHQLWL